MQTNLGDKRILLVDDDIEIRALLKDFLFDMGIDQVFEAGDGFEAIQFLDDDQHGPDLVICDWNMPKMSGHSFYRQLKTTHPETPFIMVTSRNDFDSVKLAKETGVRHYLAKPLSMTDFEKKIHSALIN